MEQYFAGLNRIERLTPRRFLALLARFENSPEQIWRANISEIVAAGVEPDAAQIIVAERARIDPAAEYEKLQLLGARVVPITSPDYPESLKLISAPPPVLLVRGAWPDRRDADALAVVGSRVTTSYGRQVTLELTQACARAGLAIISGLARGVDALAHQAAVDCGQRTVAVLGCGIDRIYPPENTALADKILASGGAIISEFAAGTEPNQYNFPQRNRIIAGLARGVLVTEAREKSGSLITAQLALEMNREVLAVPGPITSAASGGTNRLIADGARIVLEPGDIFSALGMIPAEQAESSFQPDSPAEAAIWAVLSRTPQESDELFRASGLDSGAALAALSLLEMKGAARSIGGTGWVRG